VKKMWIIALMILLPIAGEARDGYPAVSADRKDWCFWGGCWEAPNSDGAFYGSEREIIPSKAEAPKGWRWAWLIKGEAYQGQTRDGWHFGAVELFTGPRYRCQGQNGEVRFDLLFGTLVRVPEWDEGARTGAQGVTIHPQLRIDLYNSFLKPEIILAYKSNEKLEWSRFDGEGKVLLLQNQRGSFQIKGGIWGERDEVQSSYEATGCGLLLEGRLLGKSSSLTIFVKGGYAEELCNNVSTGAKWIAGCCWSF
jgi:hypothetical protein